MRKSIKQVSVFISSPSEVEDERSAVKEVIQQINELKGTALGYNLVPLTWESDVVPTFGIPAQEKIDSEIGDDYDIFLGIMSAKFGTPTGNASSGTQHEFDRAYKRKTEAPDSLEVMFFFQEVGHSGRELEVKELLKVEEFKASISDKGMYAKYKTVGDFKTKVTSYLARLLDRVIEKDSAETGRVDTAVSELKIEKEKDSNNLSDPLSILNQLEEEDEIGYIELADQASDAMIAATTQLEALSGAVTRLGQETQEHAQQLSSDPNKSSSEIRSVLKGASRSMDAFVETSSAILPLFRGHLSEGIQLSRDLLIIVSSDNVGTNNERREFLEMFVSLQENMRTGLQGFEDLSRTLASVPRAVSELNRAKRRTKAIIDGVCGLIVSAINEIDEIVSEAI